jgi:hypothetical protein
MIFRAMAFIWAMDSCVGVLCYFDAFKKKQQTFWVNNFPAGGNPILVYMPLNPSIDLPFTSVASGWTRKFVPNFFFSSS